MFGCDLETWRLQKGLSYTEVANALGLKDFHAARKICRGCAPIDSKVLAALEMLSKNEISYFMCYRARNSKLRSSGQIWCPEVSVFRDDLKI